MYPESINLSSQMAKKAKSNQYKKYMYDAKNNQQQAKKSLFPHSFRYLNASSSSRDMDDAKTNSPSLSPSPSPSPGVSEPMNDLTLQQQNEENRKSKKRKLDQARSSNTANCLRKVTLSDGSVCYTMDATKPSRSEIQQPPKKKMKPNAKPIAKSNSCNALSMTASQQPLPRQPPKKKMKINSETPIRATQQMKTTCQKTPIFETNQDFDKQIELKHKKNAKKPKLVHSNTMPVPIKYDKTKTDAAKNKKKRKRRHSTAGDWTSKTNLLASLKKQERIEDALFPSNDIQTVNLEEIFNGQQFIRVHKKIRPINLRRETQLFQQDKKLLKY